MTCGEHMRRDFHRCVPHQRLQDALEIMGDDGSDWAAVVASHEDMQWLGWITARAAAVFLGVYDRRPSEVMCRELIEAAPVVLAPEEDWSLAAARFAASGEDRLPVLAGGRMVGVAERDQSNKA